MKSDRLDRTKRNHSLKRQFSRPTVDCGDGSTLAHALSFVAILIFFSSSKPLLAAVVSFGQY